MPIHLALFYREHMTDYVVNTRGQFHYDQKTSASFVCDTPSLAMIGFDISKCGVSQTLKTPCAVKGYPVPWGDWEFSFSQFSEALDYIIENYTRPQLFSFIIAVS